MKRENRLSVKFIGYTFIFITLISLISVHLNSELISLSERSSSNIPLKSRVRSMGELQNLYNYIYIDGDAPFQQMASDMNWTGEGTEEQPFLIKDLTFQGAEGQILIDIRYTTVYFTITNCLITGGETGIKLASITNGRIENNTIRFSTSVGLWLENVLDSQIINNNFANCSTGIVLYQSTNITVETNCLSNNSDYGVQLWNANDNSIRENLVTHNRNGLEIYDSRNNNISQNILYENSEGALQLDYSFNNHFRQNNISGNALDGLSLWRSETNTIRDNQIENNYRGISLGRSPDNSIVNNTLVNNGLVLSGEEIDTYEQADVKNNTVNQKPLIWWQNVSEKIVPEAGEIILLNCSDLVITGQNITSASVGISTYFCSNISIYNNFLSNNSHFGISLAHVENCTISSNNITNNGQGIYTEHFAGVTIVDNIIKNNLERGIGVYQNDIVAFIFDGHEYQLIKTHRTWSEAKADCEAWGGHLVTIASQE
ncbi:MAG: NosD domain-containing protein, partial [Candidatus Hermodarchaeota archaeon]